MKELLTFLEGKKTYLIAAVAAIYVFGGDQGWWRINEAILGLFGFGGLASLRSAIGRQPASDGARSAPPAALPLMICGLAATLLLSGCTSLEQTATSVTSDPRLGTVTTNTATAKVTTFGGGKQTVESLRASGGKTASVGAAGTTQEASLDSLANLIQQIFNAGVAAGKSSAK